MVYMIAPKLCLMRMLNIMLEQKAIILGSVALHVMFLTNIIREATDVYGWCPGDMDLYVPNHEQHDNMQPLITYLTKYEGYQLNDLYTPTMYSLYDKIKDIILLIKGSSWIDVIICPGAFTLHPILQFHLTPVMNCIMGSGLWSVYSRPTTDGKGVTNHMTHTLDTRSPELPPVNVHAALSKYIGRGFEICQNPACW